jgi:hypothetical protein
VEHAGSHRHVQG